MMQKSTKGGGDPFAEYHERHPGASARFLPSPAQGQPAAIVVVGMLDSETAQDFFKGASEALTRLPPGSALELRLEGVRFISSTGVGTLTHLLADAEGRGVTLRISGVSPACEDVFSVLGLIRYFNIPGVES